MRASLAPTFLCAIILSGCSAKKETINTVPIIKDTPVSTMDGISVTNLKIVPVVKNVTKNIEQFGQPIANGELQAKLLQEGIFVRKISALDIPKIVNSIGDVIDDTFVWHGQILKWRDLHQRRIEPRGMRITEKGIQYFIQSGFLSLLSRSWVIEQETGVHVYLQLLPTWHVPQRRSSITGKSTTPHQSKVFHELGFETLLKDDEAIILLVQLVAPVASSGPFDEGPPALRLGEALLGGFEVEEYVHILVIEASLIPRG